MRYAISRLRTRVTQSRDCLRSLRIPRMRNAISKLRKFPDCAEHIHVLQTFQCSTQKVDAKFQHVTTVCTGLCLGGPEYKEFLRDNSMYPSLSWGPEYKEFHVTTVCTRLFLGDLSTRSFHVTSVCTRLFLGDLSTRSFHVTTVCTRLFLGYLSTRLVCSMARRAAIIFALIFNFFLFLTYPLTQT